MEGLKKKLQEFVTLRAHGFLSNQELSLSLACLKRQLRITLETLYISQYMYMLCNRNLIYKYISNPVPSKMNK